MSYQTDLSPDDRLEFQCEDSDNAVIKISVIKRTGSRVRLSIMADKKIKIRKLIGAEVQGEKR